MGLFDAFRGGSSPSPAQKESERLTEDLPSSSGVSAAALSAGLPSPSAASGTALPSGESEFYNPYKGLQTALDQRTTGEAAKVGYKLSQRPEFVFVEDSAVARRGWSENLTYYTGVGYLGGAAVGGGLGAAEALRAPVRATPSSPPASSRLRLNRLLNTGGKAGRLYGNTVGVVGLYFAASESFLFGYADEYRLPEAVPTLGAGFITGALYRIPRGPRPALVAGLVGMAGGVLMLGARSFIGGL